MTRQAPSTGCGLDVTMNQQDRSEALMVTYKDGLEALWAPTFQTCSALEPEASHPQEQHRWAANSLDPSTPEDLAQTQTAPHLGPGTLRPAGGGEGRHSRPSPVWFF